MFCSLLFGQPTPYHYPPLSDHQVLFTAFTPSEKICNLSWSSTSVVFCTQLQSSSHLKWFPGDVIQIFWEKYNFHCYEYLGCPRKHLIWHVKAIWGYMIFVQESFAEVPFWKKIMHSPKKYFFLTETIIWNAFQCHTSSWDQYNNTILQLY